MLHKEEHALRHARRTSSTIPATLTGHVLEAQVQDPVPVSGTGAMEREKRPRSPPRRRRLLLHLLEPGLSLRRAWRQQQAASVMSRRASRLQSVKKGCT